MKYAGLRMLNLNEWLSENDLKPPLSDIVMNCIWLYFLPMQIVTSWGNKMEYGLYDPAMRLYVSSIDGGIVK